jgi:malate synthase
VLAEVKASLSGEHLDEACALFEQVALDDHFVDFLTLPAYDKID